MRPVKMHDMKNTIEVLRRFYLIGIIFFTSCLTSLAQKTGVMIMAHGGGPQWNALVTKAAEPLAKGYPVSIAWGMADPVTLQRSIDELESKGVTKIIAIPLFISSHSEVIRQTEYLLGLRDKLADPPMAPMDHSGGSHQMSGMGGSSMHRSQEDHAAELKPLKYKVKLIMTHALDDDPVVAEILRDRIDELSSDPSRETVILVAHGPNSEEDNRKWIAILESLSGKIQKLQEVKSKGFKQIFSVTVRDDADKAIFDQAKEQLRALVRQAGEFGNVIVVPVFLSSGGREQAVAERLKGLAYKWNAKTLLPDSRLTDFLNESVDQALKK